MSKLVEVTLAHGIHSYDTQVVMPVNELPRDLQIPIEVQDGLFTLNHYSFKMFTDQFKAIYEFQYQQGIYDRSQNN